LVWGLTDKEEELELSFDYPARIADKLIANQIDIGLVPVAALLRIPQYRIISDFGIGCKGPVASVCLFSQVPVSEIKTVLLDYQSRTSVRLLKILMRDFWQQPVEYIQAEEGYTSLIKGTTAALVIGDRAFEQRNQAVFTYDLGEAWLAHTGKAFVFAVWATSKAIPDHFASLLNESARAGLSNLYSLAEGRTVSGYDLYTYYSKNIHYHLDAELKSGLELFLSLAPGVE
jgi:chorismate dehydratase